MRPWPLLSGVWLLACQRTEALAPLELPPGTQSLLLARIGADGSELWAADWPGDDPGLRLAGDGALTVAAFGCSLERLGLQPGTQALRSEPFNVSVLPDGLGLLSGRLVDGESRAWTTPDPPDPTADALFRRVPVRGDNRCLASRARLRPHPINLLERRGRPTFTVALDPEHVLMGARHGPDVPGTYGFVIARDGSYRTVELGPEIQLGGFVEDDGTLWLLDEHGQLSRGPLEGPRTVVATSTVERNIEYVAIGAHGGAPLELFISLRASGREGEGGRFRRFLRFDGQRLETLGSLQESSLFIPGAAWIGPGRGMGIGAGTVNFETIRYERGQVFYDQLPNELYGAASMRNIPGLGVVVGRDNGELDLFENGNWVSLGVEQGTVFTRSLAPMGDGFLYATGAEFNFLEYRFGQYFSDLGACELEDLTDYAAGTLTTFGDGSVLAATLSDFDAPAEPVLLEVLEGAKNCGPTLMPPKF